MLQLFHEFITPEQKKLTVMVEERGGVAALENEYAMKELAEAEFFFAAPSGSDSRHGTGRPSDVAELQHEIKGDPDEAIEKNAEFFNRKFDIQRRQIVEDIARAVNREGDRIISAVTAGPHDRIVDPVRCEILGHRISQSLSVSLRISTTYGRTWYVVVFTPPQRLTKRNVGMAWKRQGTTFRHVTEGLLR